MIKEHEAAKLIQQRMELMRNVDKVRSGFQMGGRVGLTQLGRSTLWRQKLEQLGALEVLDRNETAGILIEPEIFQAILDYMDIVDEELEEAQVQAMLEQRKERTNFLSGEELGQAAVAGFRKRKEQLRGTSDGNQ